MSDISLSATRLHRFVELSEQKRQTTEELETIKAELAELEELLLQQFANIGINSMRVNGRTVYIHRQLWAGAVDGDYGSACKALEAAGLGDYVQERFNTQSLSAWVREHIKTQEEARDDSEEEQKTLSDLLPEPLQGKISVTEKFNLRTRKSK